MVPLPKTPAVPALSALILPPALSALILPPALSALILAPALSALILVATASPAAAQRARDDVWLVTVVDTGNDPDTESAAAAVSELRKNEVEVIDPERAASVFEKRHSRSPVVLEPNEVEKLQQAISEVSHHLALENLTEARNALKTLEELTPDVADFLNRKMERAEQIFQACLLMAHLLRKGGYRDRAYEQVAECARSFPGFEPDQQHYPPHIIEIFRRAAAEVNASAPATVHVSATGGEGCRARINGIDWGPVPTRVPGVRAEQVRVQVDCGSRRGRIYREKIRPGDNKFVIDTRLDQVVQTEGGLWLKYFSAADSDAYRLDDNVSVARTVGAGQILQIDLSSMRLYRIDVPTGQYVAFEGLQLATLSRAIARLLDAEVPSPATPDQDKQPSPDHLAADVSLSDDQIDRLEYTEADRDDYHPKIWGYAGAAISIGAIATGWVYWMIRSDERGERLQINPETDYDGYSAPILAFTAAGSAGLIASLALALPEQRGVPWWSYIFGAGGIGLATYGIYVWAQDENACLERDQTGCIKQSSVDTLGGPFFAMQALPLLSIPATYLIRHLTGTRQPSTRQSSIRQPSISAALYLDPDVGLLFLSGRI